MPIITKQYSEHQFSGTNSSWSNMSGTNSYSFFSTFNVTSASQGMSYSTASGFGTVAHAAPAYGNTIVNFATGVTDVNYDFVVTPNATPAANRLVLIAVESQVATGTANEPTVSGGCGLTWTKVDSQTIGVRRITLFKSSGASPTNGNFTFNFNGQTQSRIYVWGYDFTNTDYSSAGSAVTASAKGSSTASTSLTVTVTASTVRSSRYVFFAARSAANTPTSTVDNWVALNSQGVGNYLSTSNSYQITYAGAGGNAMIGVSIVPTVSTGVNKTFICSSGSTPATLANGSIKMGFPATIPAVSTSTAATTTRPFLWAPTSTAVDQYYTSYFPSITYAAGKGADTTGGTGDDTGTITFAIQQANAIGVTTLVSSSINEVIGTSNTRTSGAEIWDIDFKSVRYSSTQSFLELSWDIPATPGTTGRFRGSVSTGLINTPASDLAFGLIDTSFTDTASHIHNVDYLIVSDYAVVPSAVRLQGVNRSVVW